MAVYAAPRFLPCGDLAISVEFADEVSREVNARVLALEYLIQQKGLAGVTETVPTYRSLLVYYDPSVVAFDALVCSLRALVGQARPDVLPPARTVELPCCYEGELAFELASPRTRWRDSTPPPTTTCTSWASRRDCRT
jgi:allophanate hydrolase subunit 1